VDAGLKVIAGPAAVPLADLVQWLPDVSGTLWLAGDGAEAALQALAPLHDEPRSIHYRPSPTLPTATSVGRLGLELHAAHGAADLATFEPFYLKEFVAKKPKRTIFDRLPF
jgi:tRNA threonylcarbamoyladenosine biosynthesis protein TsaB